MPALTPNRSYPYSVPTDNNDVAGAIQALAEAVDTDVQALQSLVGPRPMARVRGTTPVIHAGAASTFGVLRMEVIDFNVGGAIGPLADGTVKVLLDGQWLMVATFEYSQPSGAGIATVGANLVGLPVLPGATPFGRVNTSRLPSGTEVSRNMDVSALVNVGPSGLDTVMLESEVRRSSGGANMTFLTRTMTLLRMTES